MRGGWIAVEGHGDIAAAENLVNRLWRGLGRSEHWRAARAPKIHTVQGMEKLCARVRGDSNIGALLVLRDEDDRCPREHGPLLAETLRQVGLPFPAALVLLHPEFEVLFLPCVELLAGKAMQTGSVRRPGLQPGTTWSEGSWEARRGIKEWLTARFPPNLSYKPSTDQLPLTRMLDLEMLRRSDVPCFGTLERSMEFLAMNWQRARVVYPPTPV